MSVHVFHYPDVKWMMNEGSSLSKMNAALVTFKNKLLINFSDEQYLSLSMLVQSIFQRHTSNLINTSPKPSLNK